MAMIDPVREAAKKCVTKLGPYLDIHRGSYPANIMIETITVAMRELLLATQSTPPPLVPLIRAYVDERVKEAVEAERKEFAELVGGVDE